MILTLLPLLLAVDAQSGSVSPAPSPVPVSSGYNCSTGIAKLKPKEIDPCSGTDAYAKLGACSEYMNGNVFTPSANCCVSVQSVWSELPACFCKVTFQSKFAPPGPARARARPLVCGIKGDLCHDCPQHFGGPPDLECAASIATQYKLPEQDACNNTTAYADLGSCSSYMSGDVSIPSAECCDSVRQVWSEEPACFCKVTFFSRFQSPAAARARPLLCNITDDFCTRCPAHFVKVSARVKRNYKAIVAGISIGLVLLIVVCCGLLCCRKRIFRNYYEKVDYAQQCNEIRSIEGKPTIFPYSILKHATNDFNSESKLGEGGFGSVFRGVLPDGVEVAVKQLSAKSQQGNDEFLNEVTLITSVQHRNLVKLRGCCLKGKERLLVYEYLENKSLHQAMFDKPRMQMDWQTRMKIIDGMARGLAYLHEGCHTRIVHRDIKASNILLDRDLNPKIADFGLARIFSENDTHVSTRVAGTAGYLAPEYAMRGQLTEKADVFSYGVVVLELISGRPNLDLHVASHATYLLDWAWELYEEENLIDLLDGAVTWSEDDREEALRVVEMALLCTHSRATLRPSMTAVVSMLAGGSELIIPKFARYDVRNYSDLDFKFSGTKSDKQISGSTVRSNNSHGEVSACSTNNSGVVSCLEPR